MPLVSRLQEIIVIMLQENQLFKVCDRKVQEVVMQWHTMERWKPECGRRGVERELWAGRT